MGQHRSDFKKNRGTCKSKLVIASGDYDYCLVEKWPCADKNELHRRERRYIETNDCVNKIVPGRTQKEYKADNKEKISEYQKQYRDVSVHKERMSEYRAENKETILKQQKEYRDVPVHKERMSEYRAKNKEKIEANKSKKSHVTVGV